MPSLFRGLKYWPLRLIWYSIKRNETHRSVFSHVICHICSDRLHWRDFQLEISEISVYDNSSAVFILPLCWCDTSLDKWIVLCRDKGRMKETYSKNKAQQQISLNESLQKISRTITISGEYENKEWQTMKWVSIWPSHHLIPTVDKKNILHHI